MGIIMSNPLSRRVKCFSVSKMPGNVRDNVEKGGKIIMPPSVLEYLSLQNIVSPMLFKIINRNKDKTSHCGVLEFVADEGSIYIPHWMMSNLILKEGEEVTIESVSLPTALFSCFQPQSLDFLDITNPKAVLENCLRNFACLTTGDVISIMYNGKNYALSVLKTVPGHAVSIIECDMSVDFTAPPGYIESPCSKGVPLKSEESKIEAIELTAFPGKGCRLDGKENNKILDTTQKKKPGFERGTPDYGFQIGTVMFIRNISQAETSTANSPVLNNAFPGMGISLSDDPAEVIHSDSSSSNSV